MKETLSNEGVDISRFKTNISSSTRVRRRYHRMPGEYNINGIPSLRPAASEITMSWDLMSTNSCKMVLSVPRISYSQTSFVLSSIYICLLLNVISFFETVLRVGEELSRVFPSSHIRKGEFFPVRGQGFP